MLIFGTFERKRIMQKLGIENLKLAALFGIKFGMEFEKKLEDGKITLWEGLGLIPNLKDAPEIVRNFGSIKAEIADLDLAEKGELVDFIRENLDLKNDNVEKLIEDGIDIVVSLGAFVGRVQELKDDSVGGGGPGGDPDPDDKD